MKKAETENFETVTLRIPKAIMDFLRENKAVKAFKPTPEEYLEYAVVEHVRCDIESGYLSNPECIAEGYGLQEIFKTVTGFTVDNATGS